ncbi:MAG: hypothetical protein ACYC2H_00230 [Thermoplasmatota archaeon]
MSKPTFAAACLAALLLVSPSASAASAYPLSPGSQPVADAVGYFASIQLPSGNIGYNYMVSAWVVMGLAAAGIDPHTVRVGTGFQSIIQYLAVNDAQLKAGNAQATDWERVILALTAAGEDPRTFAGTDHVAALLGYWDGTQFGSPSALNDDFFAVLALRSAGFAADSPYVAGAANYILQHQNSDGGWSYAVGSPSDSDDTAAAVLALVAAGFGDAPATSSATAYFATIQGIDGGFVAHLVPGEVPASNTASDAWVIQALHALGEDPTSAEWTTASGANPVTHLLSLQQADGSFAWTGTCVCGPAWMTAYALPALLGSPYPVNLDG